MKDQEFFLTKGDCEIGSGNVYADLGRAAAGTLLIKAQLVSKISEILEERRLTQAKAAIVLGIPQPKLSSMLRGQFRGLSERKLMDCLTRSFRTRRTNQCASRAKNAAAGCPVSRVLLKTLARSETPNGI